MNPKNKRFYVIINFRIRIPYIRVLLNKTTHPKPIYKFECSCKKPSLIVPLLSTLTPTYIMFPHLHLLLHIHYCCHFPRLQYVPSCLWKNLYVLGGWSLFSIWNPCVASKHNIQYLCLSKLVCTLSPLSIVHLKHFFGVPT